MCIASHVPARGHNPRQHDTARAFFARVVLSGNGKCRCDVHSKFGSFRCDRQSHVVLRIASGGSAVGAACCIAAASVLLSLWIASPSGGVLLYGCRRGVATRIHVHTHKRANAFAQEKLRQRGIYVAAAPDLQQPLEAPVQARQPRIEEYFPRVVQG